MLRQVYLMGNRAVGLLVLMAGFSWQANPRARRLYERLGFIVCGETALTAE